MTKDLQTVLMVEDEADIREVVKMSLEMVGGLRVETCSSGEAAIQRAQGLAPDLILLDVMMPGMDGPSTLQGLRGLAGLERTPVVFMTAKVMQSEVEQYKALGAVEVIPKPFDPMTLADQLNGIWKRLHGGG
ncbi:MAG: response regulator [Gammaproteobacteria bacterium]|nr:response regulator [Gammaproteobacteria bacterium]